MRNFVFVLIALFAISLSSVSPARASWLSSDVLVVDVPFTFNAGSKTLPAGKYVVGRLSQTSSCLLLQNADGGPSVAVMTGGSLQSGNKKSPARLVFSRYEGQYFLAQVWPSARSAGVEISKSDDERALAKAHKRGELVAISVDK